MKKNPPEPSRGFAPGQFPIIDRHTAQVSSDRRCRKRQCATRYRLYANQNVYTSYLINRLPDMRVDFFVEFGRGESVVIMDMWG
jgi:hypothetical protein